MKAILLMVRSLSSVEYELALAEALEISCDLLLADLGDRGVLPTRRLVLVHQDRANPLEEIMRGHRVLGHAVFQRQGGLDVHAGLAELHLVQGDLEADRRGALHGGAGLARPVAVLFRKRLQDRLDAPACKAAIDLRAQGRERWRAGALVVSPKHSIHL